MPRRVFAILLSPMVLIAGCGYLVDMFDLFLFNMVRVKSLTDLNLNGEQITNVGVTIINAQLAGLVLGSYLWGTLGDKIGRRRVLMGSILVYSCATLLTSFISNEWQYGVLRFIAGIGLAGELGAGITLISEKYSGSERGIGVGFFIVLGYMGVVISAAVSNYLDWRSCYLLGGILGFLLFIFRASVAESEMYTRTRKRSDLRYGGLYPILSNKKLLVKYIASIAMLMPAVFIPQILWSLSPEIAASKGFPGIQPQIILGFGYSCVVLSNLAAIYFAEKFKNRKKAIILFAIIGTASFVAYMFWPYKEMETFYFTSTILGSAFGIWVVGVTLVAETFGTNLRATVSTTVPNFCRGTVIVMSSVILLLKPSFGIVGAVGLVGAIVFLASAVSIYLLRDTYGKNLEFTH